MATDKNANDIFARTTESADIGLGVAPRIKGRPQASEPYQKVTVCLFNRHVLFLDKVGLAIQEKTGKHIRRAELVRAIVDNTANRIDPTKLDADFDKAIRALLPNLEGKDTIRT